MRRSLSFVATVLLAVNHQPAPRKAIEIGAPLPVVITAPLTEPLSLPEALQPAQTMEPVFYTPTGANDPQCLSWMSQAGITDTTTAQLLINGESGCNPHAVNAASVACGIAQEVPCGKSGCSLDDAVCQLRWMQTYVIARYGSWGAAWAFWLAPTLPPYNQHWY